MARSLALFLVIAAVFLPAPARSQSPSPLGGVWTLDRPASEFPHDIGFNVLGLPATPPDDRSQGATGGSRGGRGSSGGGSRSAPPFPARQESYEEARLVQLLTDEARNPPARLIVVDTPSAVTITNELGQSRTLHPDGKQETIEIEGVPIGVTSRRDADTLVVLYRAGQNREVRYTYSHTAVPSRLVIDVQFLEHGAGDKARRLYGPGIPTETTSTGGATEPPPAPGAPGAPAGAPAQSKPEAFDQRPGAELRGLKSLGVLVEELSPQAIACGVNHDTIESALSKRLTDAGFIVHRNSDEDTYVYVNVMTSSAANGMCVSRYDAFLYSHATAQLSYRDRPVLVQVSLMHRGGLGTSVPASHGAAVLRGLQDYVDLFITQVRDASK